MDFIAIRLGELGGLVLAVFGLVIGSFLNVVIARVPEGLSIVSPRSRCPKCGHQLAWYENIPVVSWLALRARCKGCRAPISWQYPAIELLTGLLYFGCWWRFGFSYPLVIALVMVSLLIPLSFIDLAHWILPFELTLPGIVLGIVLAIPLGRAALIESVLGAAIAFCVFLALEWLGQLVFKKEALGGGDKYLLAMIGAFLTFRPLLGVIFLASLQGGVIGSLLLLVRGRAGPELEPESKSKPRELTPGRPPVDEEATRPTEDPETTQPGLDPERTIPPSAPPEEGGASPEAHEDEDDWVPGPTNIPFGPWLSLAALELLFFAPWLNERLPREIAWMLTGG